MDMASSHHFISFVFKMLGGLGEAILASFVNLAVNFALRGNENEMVQQSERRTLEATVTFRGVVYEGTHEGPREVVAIRGTILPRYTLRANGIGEFGSKGFNYTGRFYKGFLHDTRGEASCIIGTTHKFEGQFENGHVSGTNVMSIKVDGKWVVVYRGDWRDSKPWTGCQLDIVNRVWLRWEEGRLQADHVVDPREHEPQPDREGDRERHEPQSDREGDRERHEPQPDREGDRERHEPQSDREGDRERHEPQPDREGEHEEGEHNNAFAVLRGVIQQVDCKLMFWSVSLFILLVSVVLVWFLSISIGSDLCKAVEVGNHDVFHALQRESLHTPDINQHCFVRSDQWPKGKQMSYLTMASFLNKPLVVRELLLHRQIAVNAKTEDGMTALHVASALGHVDVVHHILQHSGRDFNSLDKNNCTSLMLASENGHFPVVEELLGFSTVVLNAAVTVSPNILSNRGYTALHLACENGHAATVGTLLNSDQVSEVDIASATPEGYPALVLAAMNGHPNTTRTICLAQYDHKVDLNILDKNGNSALMWASWNGHSVVVKDLLEIKSGEKRAAVNTTLQDPFGRTAFYLACMSGRSNVVTNILLQDNSSVNIPALDGSTPLMAAVQRGHVGVVEILLNNTNVDGNLVNKKGNTALMLACELNLVGIVELLAKAARINVTMENKDGLPAFVTAAKLGNTDTVRAMLNTSAINSSITDTNGKTALMWASQLGFIDTVNALLDSNKVNATMQDQHGETALILASRFGHAQVVTALLQVMDDESVNIQSGDQNKSALLWAVEENHLSVVKALITHNGVKVFLRREDGLPPFLVACWHGHTGIVRAMLASSGKVDINGRDSHERSCLLWASANNHLDTVRVLLADKHVNVNALDDTFSTALTFAKSPHIKALLVQHGAK